MGCSSTFGRGRHVPNVPLWEVSCKQKSHRPASQAPPGHTVIRAKVHRVLERRQHFRSKQGPGGYPAQALR